MLEVKNIRVGYGEKVVLDGLDFAIRPGEITAIIGPNGCGKSTLLKSMARMIPIQSGEVLLGDINIKEIPQKKVSQILCLLSQHNHAPDDLTVEQLVYYGRLPHKKWYEQQNKEDKELTLWAMEQTGVSKYKDTPIGFLSGGEKQRAYLAQALCQRPSILLLDEPTTYLDISYQLEVMELIKEINDKLKITVVMVLHELNQAMTYSNRLVVMQKGKVVADGSPEAIISHELIHNVYRVHSEIDYDKQTGRPRIHPYLRKDVVS